MILMKVKQVHLKSTMYEQSVRLQDFTLKRSSESITNS